jgi:hypothetical protein
LSFQLRWAKNLLQNQQANFKLGTNHP